MGCMGGVVVKKYLKERAVYVELESVRGRCVQIKIKQIPDYHFYLIGMHDQRHPPSATHAPHRKHPSKGATVLAIQRSEEKNHFQGVFGGGVTEPDLSFLSETISRIDQQYYFVSSALLAGTCISERKRAVRCVRFQLLRCWMMQEGTKIGMSRNAVASAGSIVDLFLQKGGAISVEELQLLGIAALMLVNRCGCREIKMQVDERVFPKKLLNEFQLKICNRLSFRINPVTYVRVLDELICGWNIFASKHSDLWCYQTGADRIKGRALSTGSMYQLMDTLYLVARTYTFNMFQIVLQVFRVFLAKDYEAVCSLPKPIEDEVIISFWNNPEDEPLLGASFQTLFTRFINFIQTFASSSQSMEVELSSSHEIQAYVHSFLKSGFESTIQRHTPNEPQSDRQTINSCSLKVARTFMSLKKNYRKSSGETLAL